MCVYYCLHFKSCPTLVTPWSITCQTPLSMGFPSKNTGVGCHFLLQGMFLTQGLKPHLASLALPGRFFYHYTTWEALIIHVK